MARMGWSKIFRQTASSGDAGGEFDRLLRPHVPVLYRSAYRWTGDIDRAEDLVQDTLVRLFPRMSELRSIEQLRPWVLRVMYRIFIDQLRRERSSPVEFGREPEDEEENESELEITAEEPALLVEQQLTQEKILAAWSRLSEEHRVVLSLHEIEGYTLVELAPIVDAPIGTLKSRLHRARARLRELLVAERFSWTDRV
jgi:RNA polymerase sigma-70 factor (ECF subfamily)